MSLDKTTAAKIALLARLKLAESELAGVAGELASILKFVEQLNEVETGNVPPMASVVDMEFPGREDKVSDGDCRDKVLANAPDPAHGFFTVPKVVE